MDSGVDFSSDEFRSSHKSSSNSSITEEGAEGTRTPVAITETLVGGNSTTLQQAVRESTDELHAQQVQVYEKMTEFVEYATQRLSSSNVSVGSGF